MRIRCEECEAPVFDNGFHCVDCNRLLCANCTLLLYKTQPACRGCAVDFQPHYTDSVADIQRQLDVIGKFVGIC